MTEEKKRPRTTLRKIGKWAVLAGAVLGALVIGALLHAAFTPPAAKTDTSTAAAQGPAAEETIWTCSMHPQIRQPKPGKCPLCGMDLIPAVQRAGGGMREFETSIEAAALMDIAVSRVQRRFVTAEIRMVGKVDYDETRLSYITAWVPGRLDKLHVNYTGVPVRKGEHLVYMYSPQLYRAQEELLQSLKSVRELLDSGSEILREITQATVDAAREKLRLLGVKPEQIAAVERSGKATAHMTIYSPVGGIVVHKNAQEGMYVKTGTRIYTIADLSQVWVQLDAYESDLMWLRYGQEVEFTTVSYPGQPFRGMISFIDPILDPKTRTAKVRVIAKNTDGRLKPGMFVKAIARPNVAAGGRVMDPALAGKWICPMHHDVIRDESGFCDQCKMPLERIEDLGFISVDAGRLEAPLVIPVTAVLKTGTRGVVYVQLDPSLLRDREVTRWPELIQRLKTALSPPTTRPGGFLNTRCPIMGTQLDLAKVPEELARPFEGGKVAFCCGGCPRQWDALPTAQKRQKLAEASEGQGPMQRVVSLLGGALRTDLLAADPARVVDVDLKERLIGGIKALLQRRDFYDEEAFGSIELDEEGAGLLDAGLANLSPLNLTRFNRLVLDSLLTGVVAKAHKGVRFEGREVVLGPRAGGFYLVRSSLAEGEFVATRGTFKIDSALQISAKPSMMSPDGGAAPTGHEHHGKGPAPKGPAADPKPAAKLPTVFQHQVRGIHDVAKAVADALRGSDLKAIRNAFVKIEPAVKAVDGRLLAGKHRIIWDEARMRLINDGVEGTEANPEETHPLEAARRVGQSLRDNLAFLKARLPFDPTGDAATRPAVHADFRRQLGQVLAAYFDVQAALAADSAPKAIEAATKAQEQLAGVKMSLLTGSDHDLWMTHAGNMKKALAAMVDAGQIGPMRKSFALLSEHVTAVAGHFGSPTGEAVYEMKCTMAFSGRGARWLQFDKQIRNPYFGAAMPGCGEVTSVIEPRTESNAGGAHLGHSR